MYHDFANNARRRGRVTQVKAQTVRHVFVCSFISEFYHESPRSERFQERLKVIPKSIYVNCEESSLISDETEHSTDHSTQLRFGDLVKAPSQAILYLIQGVVPNLLSCIVLFFDSFVGFSEGNLFIVNNRYTLYMFIGGHPV